MMKNLILQRIKFLKKVWMNVMLKKNNAIKISDNAIKEIINGYTRESGVRSLERQINKVVRKSITELIKTNKKSIIVSSSKLEKYLGPSSFLSIYKEKQV